MVTKTKEMKKPHHSASRNILIYKLLQIRKKNSQFKVRRYRIILKKTVSQVCE